MARTSFVDIVPGLEAKFWASLTPQDRFTFSRVTRKIKLLSVRRRRGLTRRSLLPQIAGEWNLLSDSEKIAWGLAGSQMRLTGYRLFVQDQSIRIINNLPGHAVPDVLRQSWFGKLNIAAPAKELKIVQLHPAFYWVARSVRGRKGMFEPVMVREDLRLPLQIGLSYRAELQAVGPAPDAKFFACVYHNYQGRTLETKLEIPLLFSTIAELGIFNLGLTELGAGLDVHRGWYQARKILSQVIGLPVRYDLYFELKDLTGVLYIDNIKSVHSGQNWARDAFCRDINQGFTRAFFQIPRHWAAVIAPVGTFFESNYKDF